MPPDHPPHAAPAGDTPAFFAEWTKEELIEEVMALRRRMASLEEPARRFRAIFEAPVLSVQVFNPEGHYRTLNPGSERLWGLSLEQVSGFNTRTDPQIAASGLLPLVERAFHGEATAIPPLRYDPQKTETLQAGSTNWMASAMFPVKDEAGELREVVMLQFEVGELKQSEDELRARQEELERAVDERTQELAESLERLEREQRAVRELSTPVIRVWEGVLVLPLIGELDPARAAQLTENLLGAIVAERAGQVILDVTGVAMVDSDVAAHLMKTVTAVELLGSRAVLVGISPAMAQALVHLDIDFRRVTTCATLEDGLREVFSRMNYQVTRRATPG